MAPPVSNEILQAPDDAWEILRDCRVFFLKQLARLLQEAEPFPEEPLRAFVKAAGAYFDDIVSTEKRSRFDQLGSRWSARMILNSTSASAASWPSCSRPTAASCGASISVS